MAFPAYSTRFIGARINSSSATYTVPAGMVAVLNSVTLVGQSGTPEVTIYVEISGGATVQVLAQLPGVASSPAPWSGRVVLNPADVLYVGVGAGECDVVASGYLFLQL